jgi:tRNA-Thr(GGU) m(6)t(6)A37 methyltransferase TsaA
MAEELITYRPIGTIHSGHTDPEATPIQPAYARGERGRVEVLPRYADGLRDLDGFSHLYLIYHLHEADRPQLLVRPFLQDLERGVFATRAPCRPNPIGISIVRLLRRRGNILEVEDLDVLDGTPLLDIKPYAARFDRIDASQDGWHSQVDEETARRRGRRKSR